MPPNAKGGKGYRKGKHGGDAEAKLFDWDEDEGQMLGRVLKKLGNRRFRVYCNDNQMRLCKLTGSMRKSEWVDEGALVLLGIRSIGTSTSEKGGEVADVLTLVDTGLYGKLKKVKGVNPILFSHLEKEDASELSKRASGEKPNEDDIFDRGGEDDSSVSSEEEEEAEDSKAARRKSEKLRGQKLSESRQAKSRGGGDESARPEGGSDDIDIDAI